MTFLSFQSFRILEPSLTPVFQSYIQCISIRFCQELNTSASRHLGLSYCWIIAVASWLGTVLPSLVLHSCAQPSSKSVPSKTSQITLVRSFRWISILSLEKTGAFVIALLSSWILLPHVCMAHTLSSFRPLLKRHWDLSWHPI